MRLSTASAAILACLLALAAPSAAQTARPAGAEGEHLLRYDGVYQSGHSEPRVPGTEFGPWSYLRFYPNGTVVTVATSGRPEDLGWLKITDESYFSGRWALQGNVLSFSVRGGNDPAIDYVGTVVGDRLYLHVRSHINGYQGDEVYLFFPTAWAAPAPE
ncbi:hypothetical protein [Longimicrobium sp.]|uniref:hypothetical protein n=1 Tax=Longimicrobium sp. TaxID=2029185 RepID=UPI002C47528D|nr:hypothetical protein [Longimicrobium sp.]HSU13860.1 hypothetical protein [Longimicrobium sp.]